MYFIFFITIHCYMSYSVGYENFNKMLTLYIAIIYAYSNVFKSALYERIFSNTRELFCDLFVNGFKLFCRIREA